MNLDGTPLEGSDAAAPPAEGEQAEEAPAEGSEGAAADSAPPADETASVKGKASFDPSQAVKDNLQRERVRR